MVYPLLTSGCWIFSHLNNNTLTGEIPVELSKLNNLAHLWGFSFFLFSWFHFWILYVKCLYWWNKSRRILDNNNLTGSLPQELARLPSFTILYVPFAIFGPIFLLAFKELCKFAKLVFHLCSQMDNNNFDGSEIPEAYGRFSRLVRL